PPCTHKDMALPLWKALAGVDDDAGRGNRRVPEEKRLLHPWSTRLGKRRARPARAFAAVRPAVRDHRPAVVLAGLNDVDFVAAKRSILRVPDLAGLGMDDQAERVANAEGIDLRLVARPAGGRVIGRA